MKAVVYTQYGSPDVLHLAEVAKPTPKANEVLVKVHATTVTAGDSRMRSFTVPRRDWLFARLYLGVFKPRRPILGMELAGVVESVGKGVKRFNPGDAVFALTMGSGFGGYAEYKCLPENKLLALKPSNATFEEAAAISVGGVTALGMLRKVNVQRGQKVLIYGASGSVGTFAVQIAKHLGAEVTAVCSSSNVDMVKALGADHVIDYTREDFSRPATIYDVILDVVAKAPPSLAKNTLKPSGTFLSVTAFTDQPKIQTLVDLKNLIEAGHVTVAIDRCYPLAQTAEAHRYVDAGHKKGNVIITVASKN